MAYIDDGCPCLVLAPHFVEDTRGVHVASDAACIVRTPSGAMGVVGLEWIRQVLK